jgi:hypothetical protein
MMLMAEVANQRCHVFAQEDGAQFRLCYIRRQADITATQVQVRPIFCYPGGQWFAADSR